MPYAFDSLPLIIKEFAKNIDKKNTDNITDTWNSSSLVRQWYTGQYIDIKPNKRAQITADDLIRAFKGVIKTRSIKFTTLFCTNNEALITALRQVDTQTLSLLLLDFLSITSQRVTKFLYDFVKQLSNSLEEEQGKMLLNTMLNDVKKQSKCAFQKDKKKRIEQLLRNDNFNALPVQNSLPEKELIDKFKRAITKIHKGSAAEVKRLWQNEPSIRSWFSGHPLEITENGEKKHLCIDDNDLFKVYLQLLRTQEHPLIKLFWEDNTAIAECVKQRALDEQTNRDFLSTLLASDGHGRSQHIYTVLKFFPHDLLKEIMLEKKNSAKRSDYITKQIQVINLVLQDLPYPNTRKKNEKTSDLFLKKFEEFSMKIDQRKLEEAEEMLENDASIERWFLGQEVIDQASKTSRRISIEQLIQFFNGAVKAKNKFLFEQFVINNENLIATFASLDKNRLQAIIVSTLNMSANHCVKTFFCALIEQNPEVITLLKEQRAQISSASNKGRNIPKNQVRKLDIIRDVLNTFNPAKKVLKKRSAPKEYETPHFKKPCTEAQLRSNHDNVTLPKNENHLRAAFSDDRKLTISGIHSLASSVKKEQTSEPIQSHPPVSTEKGKLKAAFSDDRKLTISGMHSLTSSVKKEQTSEPIQSHPHENGFFSSSVSTEKGKLKAAFSGERKLTISGIHSLTSVQKEQTPEPIQSIKDEDTKRQELNYLSQCMSILFNHKAVSYSPSKEPNSPEPSLQSPAERHWKEGLTEEEAIHYIDFLGH